MGFNCFKNSGGEESWAPSVIKKRVRRRHRLTTERPNSGGRQHNVQQRMKDKSVSKETSFGHADATANEMEPSNASVGNVRQIRVSPVNSSPTPEGDCGDLHSGLISEWLVVADPASRNAFAESPAGDPCDGKLEHSSVGMSESSLSGTANPVLTQRCEDRNNLYNESRLCRMKRRMMLIKVTSFRSDSSLTPL